MNSEIWACSSKETKKSKKDAPVPDQKGEKEGGTKPQPPEETTEKHSKRWRRKWGKWEVGKRSGRFSP